VIPLVSDQFARLRLCRRGADLPQGVLCRRQSAHDRRRVTLVGRMQRCRDDNPAVEIDGVLGLVCQVRTAVLQLRDLRLLVGLAGPLLIRQLLALAGTIDANKLVRRRRTMPLSLAICVSISR